MVFSSGNEMSASLPPFVRREGSILIIIFTRIAGGSERQRG